MSVRFHKLMMLGLAGLLTLAAALPALASTNAAERGNTIVITFKDGHQQSYPLADVAKIEFKTQPAAAPAKKADAGEDAAARHRFIGQWTVGDRGSNRFTFTFAEDGSATNTVDGGHGTWSCVNGEARVNWDNGWHDIIRKVGNKYRKFAFVPGTGFDGKPDHVADAEKNESN